MAKSIKKQDDISFRHRIMHSAISLVLLTTILVFCCIVNLSLGWFAESQEVSADNMSVSVNGNNELTANLYSYPITNITGNEYTIFYETQSFTLPTNDPNEISYSTYKKALAVIIDITSDYEQDMQVAITASSGLEGLALENNFLSNCISVKRAVLSGEGNVIATTTGVAETFLSIDGAEATKVDEIILDTIQVDQNTKICYIIEYDVSLLGYIHNVIKADNHNADFVVYANDLDFIIY